MKTISLCKGTNDLPNSPLSAMGAGVSLARHTCGEAVGKARAGRGAARRAVTLQDAVVQQVPRPLRREGGAFALHDAQLTHHTGTWKKRKT